MDENINKPLMLGDNFPEMTVYTTQGKMNIPSGLKGSHFMLFSHPADFTPVCTTEFIALQRKMPQFDELNCKLIGLSVDQIFSHIKWLEWIKEKVGVEITFPVIAATESLANRLGIIHPGKGLSAIRSVFICDTEGKIRVILYYPPEVGRNIDELIRCVTAIATCDEKGVALPADWPYNELIQDKGLMPPPTNIQKAKEMANNPDSYDWWFSYKNL